MILLFSCSGSQMTVGQCSSLVFVSVLCDKVKVVTTHLSHFKWMHVMYSFFNLCVICSWNDDITWNSSSMRRFWNMLSAVCCFDCVTCDRRTGKRVRETWASTDQVSQAAVIFEVSVYMPMVVQTKKSLGLGLLTQSCIWPVFHFRPHAKISPLLRVGCSLCLYTSMAATIHEPAGGAEARGKFSQCA